MKHFTFEQFAESTTARNNHIDNSVPSEYRSHAQELVDTILDPLIDAWGSGVYMSSGYRCYTLNKKIGGSTTSAHSYAYAADLVPKNGKIEEFKDFTMHWLLDNNIKFDQYINEYSGSSSWVHIGVRNGSGQQRQQYMLYRNKTYTHINPNLYKGGSSTSTSSSYQYTEASYGASGSGSTQTGNTNGVLVGKSVYLKDIDWAAVKSNAVFAKGADGEPLTNSNGEFIMDDSYLFEANESVSDQISSVDELPEEPVNIEELLSTLDIKSQEMARGLMFNADGTYVAKKSKTIRQIIAMLQQWWLLVQRLKNTDFKNIKAECDALSDQEHQDEQDKELPPVNAMVYMKAAFDMYGHAYREGMMCPVCGKKARYLPPGGYCSVECLMKDAKDKALAFLLSPNIKYKWLYEIVDQICAILDQSTLILNAIVMIPDIIRELATLPDDWKEYAYKKITEGFATLQELIEEAMKKKNELLKRALDKMSFGSIAKPIAMAFAAIDAIKQSIEIAKEALDIAVSTIKLILKNLAAVVAGPPGLVIPSGSFAWALTPRSFICPRPVMSSPDAGKIFVVLPNGAGLENAKVPLIKNALENINIEAIESTLQSLFPPLTPVDYYLPHDLFKVRWLFSDKSDLIKQIRQQLEMFLVGGPDYIPKFEDLLPIKVFTIDGQKVPLPNVNYLWFLLGLFDAWAPHSTAMVGSLIHPEV